MRKLNLKQELYDAWRLPLFDWPISFLWFILPLIFLAVPPYRLGPFVMAAPWVAFWGRQLQLGVRHVRAMKRAGEYRR